MSNNYFRMNLILNMIFDNFINNNINILYDEFETWLNQINIDHYHIVRTIITIFHNYLNEDFNHINNYLNNNFINIDNLNNINYNIVDNFNNNLIINIYNNHINNLNNQMINNNINNMNHNILNNLNYVI